MKQPSCKQRRKKFDDAIFGTIGGNTTLHGWKVVVVVVKENKDGGSGCCWILG
jgi:hypothetical protein